MFDNDPDWGPSRHDPESRWSVQALDQARELDRLDGEPPEDN